MSPLHMVLDCNCNFQVRAGFMQGTKVYRRCYGRQVRLLMILIKYGIEGRSTIALNTSAARSLEASHLR